MSWWRNASIYQVYLRSFADGNGDGIGDLAGLRANLQHIAGLGFDAIWLNPWYPSPLADGGYDVADYRDIEPVFGSLADRAATPFVNQDGKMYVSLTAKDDSAKTAGTLLVIEIEALASGKPAIAFDRDVLSFLTLDGKNFLVKSQ